jgi:hypothetical protein
VRITVRAGEAIIVREGIGTGVGRSAAAETAHEIALKAAETDATKRALATFGNPFGLALYDKERRGVTKPPAHIAETSEILPPVSPAQDPLLLRRDDGRTESFDGVEAFVTATVQAVHALKSSESVYAFWEANKVIDGLRDQRKTLVAESSLGALIGIGVITTIRRVRLA